MGETMTRRRRMPRQRPAESKQDYRTPDDFLSAVRHRFGRLEFDLAARADNSVIRNRYYSRLDNALVQPWDRHTTPDGWSWLNPEFSDIGPWVERADLERAARGARVLMLVPASVGSKWWRDHVHMKAMVYFLSGRLTFKGHTDCYPKDCALLVYARDVLASYDVWTWTTDVQR